MDTNNPLAQLKDVHLPAPVSAFPLAYGWYALISLILIMTLAFSWWLFKQRQKVHQIAKIKQLFEEIELKANQTSPAETIAATSILLKRVARLRFPQHQPQLLFGAKWLQFLDETGKTDAFSQGPAKCLADIYKPSSQANQEQFFVIVKRWLEVVL